jgi:hypothetical protein
MNTPLWLQVMRDITGTHEMRDNPVILAWPRAIAAAYPEMASYCAGYTHDSISWCGLAVAYAMTKAGIKPVFGATDTSRFLWALAWKGFGEVVPAGQEQPGDVVIFVWDDGGHHVSLLESVEGATYVCRGGNQSDQVKVSNFAARNCVGIRRPAAVARPPAPPPDPSPDHVPDAQWGPLGDGVILHQVERWAIDRSPAVARWRADIAAKLKVIEQELAAGPDFAAGPVPSPRPLPQPVPLPHPAPDGHEPPPHGAVQRDIIATCFGGSRDIDTVTGRRQVSAYDGSSLASDTELFVSLPHDFGHAPPMVAIVAVDGRALPAPALARVRDKGPITTHDDYFITGMRPYAERNRIKSQAGIDLSPGLVVAIGAAPDAGAASRWKGKVDWYLVMDESEGDAPMTFQQPQQSQQPNIPAFLLNWRTSAAGAVPILLALADLLNQLTSGHLDPNHLYADLGAISMGLGLVGAQDGRK